MTDEISIAGLPKAAVLAALYNRAQPQGMGYFHYTPEPMTVEQAEAILRVELGKGRAFFDYLKGRVMKVSLDGDTIRPWAYDRDNGVGAVEAVIAKLRAELSETTTKEQNRK